MFVHIFLSPMLMLLMNTVSYVAGYRKTAYSANSVAVLAQDGNGMLLLYIVQLLLYNCTIIRLCMLER